MTHRPRVRLPRGEWITLGIFAAVTAMAVAALGLIIGLQLTSSSSQEAARDGQQLARTLADTALAPLLRSQDLRQPLDGTQISSLNEIGAEIDEAQEFSQVKVWNLDRTVVWSDSPALINKTFGGGDDLAAALRGQASSEVGTLDPLLPEHQGLAISGQVVEVYEPLFEADDTTVIGAVEIYTPYAPLLAAVNTKVHRTDEALGIGLGLLWLVQLTLVGWTRRRVTRYAGAARDAADRDALTGLASRTRFGEAVDGLSRDEGFAVAVLDIDGLRRVNDALGTQAGDELLVRIGDRLTGAMLPGEVLARLGGDEYALAMPGLSAGEAVQRADALRAMLGADVDLGEVPVAVDVSIGIAMHPEDGWCAPNLLQSADAALRTAKLRPEGVALFDAEAGRADPARLALASELRHAIEGGQLVLHVQPKASLPSGEVHAAEALVRWQHPERGLIPPGAFLEVAETTSLIGPLTRWVLREALHVAAGWAAAGSPLTISVNLSARSLHDPTLPALVEAELQHYGVPAHLLRLEITETAVSSDPIAAGDVLRRLRGLGVTLSLDDFGAGFTALAQLRDLPLTELKIDRAIVGQAVRRPADAAVLRAMVGLGHDLGLIIVAEGVEDADTQQLLVSLGCDEMQGYHFARPMPTADLLPWLAARRIPVQVP